MSRTARSVLKSLSPAGFVFLLLLSHSWAGNPSPQLRAITKHRSASISAFANVVRDLDELLKAEGIVGGAEDVNVEGALVAHTPSGTFIRAGLLRGETCILSFPGCEEILGVFLTTSELVDPDSGQVVPPGTYLARKRPESLDRVFFELLDHNGALAYSRGFGPGIPLHFFRNLALSWRNRALEVCVSFFRWGSCWEAAADADGPVDADEIIRGTGTVRLVPVEGGCWGIATANRQFYETPDLPDEFREDGLRVRFTARVLHDVGTVCQIAQIVELIEVEPLGAAFNP